MRIKELKSNSKEDHPFFLRIVFPWKIPDQLLPLTDQGFDSNCENVKWKCIEYLMKSEFFGSEINHFVSDVETYQNEYEQLNKNQEIIVTEEKDFDLVKFLPAFGLMKKDESVWFPSNHVFKISKKQQTCKFRIRHRPCLTKVFVGGNLFSEFFILQILDDYLFGSLGEVVTDILHLQLTTLALLISSCCPSDNSLQINESYKLKNLQLLNYHKQFSKHIYTSLISSRGFLNRIIDHVLLYIDLKNEFEIYKNTNKQKKLKDYKETFLEKIFENFPCYCFENFSVKILTSTGIFREAKFSIIVFDGEQNQKAGIYLNGIRHCGLEEIEELRLINSFGHGSEDWEVKIFCRYGPMLSRSVFLGSREKALSLISMLQGYMTLCVRPDLLLCRQLASVSDTIRERLKSFCPLSHRKALEYLKKDNLQPLKRYSAGFIIYQSTTTLHLFHVATMNHQPVCNIQWVHNKGYTLPWSHDSEAGDEQKYDNVNTLRAHLEAKYGSQLNAKKIEQEISYQSMFFIDKPDESVEDLVELNRPIKTEYLLSCDLEPLDSSIQGCASGGDTHLNRYKVSVKGTEESRLLVELVPMRKGYMQALCEGMETIANLSRLNYSNVLQYYGQLTTGHARPTFLLESSQFGNLVEFLHEFEDEITLHLKMELALQVVKILCILVKPRDKGKMFLHGNLQARNLYVFKKDILHLKLGDPGLVHYYNTLPLDADDNLKRLPWLSPERLECDNLSKTTEKSECYASATAIAEIFHGTEDFSQILGLESHRMFKSYFVEEKKQIPLPSFPECKEKAVMQSVREVTNSLWQVLSQCWHPDPQERPVPSDFKDMVSDLLEQARSIPDQTIFGHFKSKLKYLYQVPEESLQTMDDCCQLLKERQSMYITETSFTFDPSKHLGTGAFGRVVKGELIQSKREIAIKISRQSDPASEEDFMREMEIYGKLSHSNIVEYLHWSYIGAIPCIIMEFMNQGKLETFINKYSTAMESENRREKVSFIRSILKLCLDIAKGMTYLEENKVVHSDLAVRNVLLHRTRSEIVAKVSDFGLAKVMNKGKDYFFSAINPQYMPIYWYAPEYLNSEPYENGRANFGIEFTSAGDVWAFGTTLWEIFHKCSTPKPPIDSRFAGRKFRGFADILCYFYIDLKERLPRAECVDERIYSLMGECWVEDRYKRPKFVVLQQKIQDLIASYTGEQHSELTSGKQ